MSLYNIILVFVAVATARSPVIVCIVFDAMHSYFVVLGLFRLFLLCVHTLHISRHRIIIFVQMPIAEYYFVHRMLASVVFFTSVRI